MKKKMLLVPLALLLAVSLVVIGCPAPDPAVEPAPLPIELRFNSMYSPAHPINVYVFEVWAEEVEKRTDGRVKVTLFPGSALAGPREAFDATIAGITDIAVSCPSYAPERFPLTSSVELPMLGPTATISSRVVWTIYEKFPEVRAEYAEVKLLWLYANPPTHLHFVRDPVHTLEDLEGLVISAGGKKTAEMVERLGAAELSGSVFDKHQKIDTDWMQEGGHTFYTLPPEEKARWVERVMPMRDAWVSEVEARGLPGREVLDEVIRLIEEYK